MNVNVVKSINSLIRGCEEKVEKLNGFLMGREPNSQASGNQTADVIVSEEQTACL